MANDLTTAYGEFDYAALIKRPIGVFVSGIIEFQNRNRVTSIAESDGRIYVSQGINLISILSLNLYLNIDSIAIGKQRLQVKSVLELDTDSYELAMVKFQQMYRGKQDVGTTG
jgi:hypothetical protein